MVWGMFRKRFEKGRRGTLKRSVMVERMRNMDGVRAATLCRFLNSLMQTVNTAKLQGTRSPMAKLVPGVSGLANLRRVSATMVVMVAKIGSRSLSFFREVVMAAMRTALA